jgi:dolichol kinase
VIVALAISVCKILGSVALLTAVLFGATRLTRRLKLQPEVGRKLVHMSLGLYSLTFPLLFSAAWEAAATCALGGVVFLIARRRPALGDGLHGVQRRSYGELMFALSVALLFYLKDGHYVFALRGGQTGPQLILYVLPLSILTLCDAASALVGVNYGRIRFPIEGGVKSLEGVITFILTAWLLSLMALLTLTDLPRTEVIVLALVVALFGALFEAASWRGLDNLFIPLGLYFILANLIPRGLEGLLVASLTFVVVAGGLMMLGVQRGVSPHVVASGSILLFCVEIFAGPLAMLTPAAVFCVYFAVWRRGERSGHAHDALDLIAVMLALALGIFVLSNLIGRDTIFVFNLTFASLACGVLVRFGRFGAPVTLTGVAAICLIGLVRALAAPFSGASAVAFAAAGVGVVGLVAAVAWLLKRASPARPWVKLSALSFTAGLAALLLPVDVWPATAWTT